jgi:hypothetical protein
MLQSPYASGAILLIAGIAPLYHLVDCQCQKGLELAGGIGTFVHLTMAAVIAHRSKVRVAGAKGYSIPDASIEFLHIS